MRKAFGGKMHLKAKFSAITLIVALVFTFPNLSSTEHSDEHDDLEAMFDMGEQCEEPLPPMNGEMQCGRHKKINTRFVCKAECDEGYQFPNGKPKKRHICDMETGKWTPDFVFPECEPICDPPCQNGGKCTEQNHCVCLPGYRGSHCEYSHGLCNPSDALDVKGDWRCNHTSLETMCVLNCPQGTQFETQPADLYRCSLEGAWTPDSAPKCLPMNIIEPPSSHGIFPISTGQRTQTVSSDVCVSWSQLHYRTFDGGMFSFQGGCTYLLSKDCSDNTFAIHVNNAGPCESPSNCQVSVVIYVGPEEFLLTDSPDGPVVEYQGQTHIVPTAVRGMLFQPLSDYVSVTSPLGFRLKWNRKGTVLLKMGNQMKNKTCGLCGRFDGSVLNDFEMPDGTITDNVEAFVNSWTMDSLEGQCRKGAVVEHPCNSVEKIYAEAATRTCERIHDAKFSPCHTLVDPRPYYEACRMDYCSCSEQSESCICNSLEEYFRECLRLGGQLEGGWRSEELCPRSCPAGMVYEDCGSSCPMTCKSTVYSCEDEHCVDGCHCPEGTLLHQNQCLPKSLCPCTHSGKEYDHGSRITQECNACECLGGRWECTKEKCEARCSSTGDPHYTTFDGVKYEFLGSCPYYLVYHNNFTIVQENGPCPRSPESAVEGEHSTEAEFCTDSIAINYQESNLVLKPNTQPVLDDKGISSYPFSENGLTIDEASSMFLKVELSNGVSLLWDGKNRIYIDVPPSMFGQTEGLCGTFNRNQNDDFVTPEGDLEADITVFASRWKASDSCHKRSRRRAELQPCAFQQQKLPDAMHLCSLLKNEIFEACHNEVDPDPFYRSCVSDLCACTQDLEECLCASLSDYAATCSRKGVVVNWAETVAACMPRCENGQVYQECGNPCKTSCLTISMSEDCQEKCVQGCACPDGMTLNADGFCIPIDQCPCVYKGKEYTSHAEKFQGTNVCRCENAVWDCRSARLEELVRVGNDMMVLDKPFECDSGNHQEYTQCMPACRRTCQNLRLPTDCLTLDCNPGCKCKDGYVLDEDLNKCVRLSECGCRHGRRKYAERSRIQKNCNLCTCEQGAWMCTEKVCPGICTAWGESHFKTFDGRIFDFHGDCDYTLVKGTLEGAEFSLSMRNVPCGTSGITCSKSFTLDLGEDIKVTLSRDEPLPTDTYGSRLMIYEVGLFVSVYTDIGITLRWDKGTRMYITVDPQWREKVVGLCGNFNDDQFDDFLSPFGGIPEVRPTLFADSWKIQETCPASQTIDDACLLHPDRETWARQKCSVIKSELFSTCHSEVALGPFYERCVFDTCACDIGGDCECLCTTIAAYAQECNVHGVHIAWRTQELCPIQCEECSTYESCMTPCPVRTCESQPVYENIDCDDESCIEGCNPKPCPSGQIFNNVRELKCIPEVECVVPCMEINGRMYNEGERITDPYVADACQSCHCLRGSVSCAGEPCPTTTPVVTLPTVECRQTGWTQWINTPKAIGGDYENMNSFALFSAYSGLCGPNNVTDVECRVEGSKVPYKETGQNVLCALPDGLICKDELQNSELCEDYEIRLYCDCGPVPTTATAQPTTTERVVLVPPMCQAPGWTYWLNSFTPNENGEFETIRNLRRTRLFCPDDEIENIECRNALTGLEYDGEDPHVTCDKNTGLECVNTDDYRCDDYEVRFRCRCSFAECDYPRGMKNGNIKKSQITVSSFWTEEYDGDSGRVNGLSAWRSGNVELPQWIQVDLEEDQEITGVYTQGNPLADEWVTTFKMSYSQDGEEFTYVKDSDGNDKIFSANVDRNSYVYNEFPTFYARYVKLIPVGWHNWISLRFELLGCNRGAERDFMPDTEAKPRIAVSPHQVCQAPGWTYWINSHNTNQYGDFESIGFLMRSYTICPEEDIEYVECRSSTTRQVYEGGDPHVECNTNTGLQCITTDDSSCDDYEIRFYCRCSHTVCAYPRGMEKGYIKDSQILVSSFWMEDTGGNSSRLNGKSAWRTGNVELQQWIQVDLEEQQEITGIVTQGSPISDEWVKVYKVSYSNDGVKFTFVKDSNGLDHIFIANEDGNTEVENTFSPIYARFVRIIPVEWHNWISMRFEILGCNVKAPLTETTTVPSCAPGWTDYFNVDTPENQGDDGDEETIERILEQHQEICRGGIIENVECASSEDGKLIDYKKTGQFGLKCSKNIGFVCNNYLQARGEKCLDYMVRFLCVCEEGVPPRFPPMITPTTTVITTTIQVTTPELVPTTTPTTSTTEVTTTISPCPPGQVFDLCAYPCDQTCLSFLETLQSRGECTEKECVEGCRPAHGCDSPNFWRDFATCVSRDECTCIYEDALLAPNEVVEKDCMKCQCTDNNLDCFKIPYCGETTPTGAPHIIETTVNIVNEDCWTDWINIDTPLNGGGDLEIPSKIRKLFEFCLHPVEIECRSVDNKQKASDTGQNVQCDLLSGLQCWNSQQNEGNDCYDYEIRFFCPCATVPLPTTPITTLPPSTMAPAPCTHGWTEWFNKHKPDSYEEYETVQSIRMAGGYFCSNDMITAIECRKTSGPAAQSLESGVICDLEVGLMCRNSDLSPLMSCSDYEVRFFCDCPTQPPTTEATTPRPTTTTITTLKEITTLAIKPCAQWSDWINEHHPYTTEKGSKKGQSTGDYEKRMLLRFQNQEDFCLEGELTAIECRDAETDLDYTETGDLKLKCNLKTGFRCRNKDQRSDVCRDYKIRYFCSCVEETSTTVIVKPKRPNIITPPPPVAPCSSYYQVVDGPFPLPDSNLRASTSKDPSSGPQSARLSSVQGLKSSGAWIAGTLDVSQYLEIDLGKIQPIYGVVTKGRDGADEWVKSYYVLFSRDGISYTYVYEEPDFQTEKEFPGNYDSDTLVEHIFRRPFEARYVRIQPVTYMREIALRADVLGCAEGFTTVKPTTTYKPPICEDEMGMENGNISDSQITASSFRGTSSGTSFIRLNTVQTGHHTGGWVADILDENQYVQIDFLEPRTVTGIITQGRELVSQWVTSYTVLYSQDGADWNFIMDVDGKAKVFPGNFDSDTTVQNFFPHAVRAQFIRIKPLTWNNWISMRLEVLGCFEPYPVISTTTVPCTLSQKSQRATCEIHGPLFNTFDGYAYDYEICDHVLMKATMYADFSVQVHKECYGKYGNCSRYVVIRHDGNDIQIGPKLDDVLIDGNEVPFQNFWVVERRFPDFILNRTKDHVMMSSLKYDFTVTFDYEQNIKILISACPSYEILGLCGNSNGDTYDDQQRPDGSLATGSKDFGDSWSIGDMDHCIREECRSDIMAEAVEICHWLKVPPLSICASYVNVPALRKDCIDFICDCSPPVSTNPEDSCRCKFYQRFVDECSKTDANLIGRWKPALACEEQVKEFSVVPTTPKVFELCYSPMGFESKDLPDSFILVSSSASPETDGSRIRLGTHSNENGAGGWVASSLDYNPSVMIDFFGLRNITGIITQGREDADMWVVSYTVQYSLDGVEWKYCVNSKNMSIFIGNDDRSSPVVHYFAEMVEAEFVKIVVQDYHGAPAMRLELLGCFVPYAEVSVPPVITTTEFCIEYGPWISLSEPTPNMDEEEPLESVIQASGICDNPMRIQCRTAITKTDYTATGQNVICDLTRGLLCRNMDQNSGYCKNYEVRIGCWSCGPPSTTMAVPVALCPETPITLEEQCPTSCPADHACDGTSCVPHTDCPCFQEGKRFPPGDRMITSECLMCDCILEGHSKCKPMTCPDCKEGQKSELTKDCKCICTGCPVGEHLCPSNGQCLGLKFWCDGVVHCPDDEIGCPTTAPPTTTETTYTPSVTPAPFICLPEMQSERVTCEMAVNLFNTFDGLEYQYEICDHVLMEDHKDELFGVTVHKKCLPDQKTCSRYVVIYVEDETIKLGPGAEDLYLNDYEIPIQNLWLVTKRYPDFVFRKEGNNLVVGSLKYNFDVTWDSRQEVKITMSKCSRRQVVGLCGFYNDHMDDDRLKPDGSLASGNEEFGDSWSIGNLDRCVVPKCPVDIMTVAFETCQELNEIPFSNCSSYLNIASHSEACMAYMCECLQRESEQTVEDSTESCKCKAYGSFVEACEKISMERIHEWRLKYDCAPKCPPGMEWHECGSGCELTCDNYRNSDEICTDQCIPGCYCPAGLVRHRNRCIRPKMCQDCVCRGHGDPNYITFDGHYYAFQGNCTYVLAQHMSDDHRLNFQVLATNVECPEEPHTSCTAGIKVIWNDHTVVKFKNEPIHFDGRVLNAEDFPFEDESFTISYVPQKSAVIHVKDINLVVRYFDQMYGYNIELPSYLYFNQTEGLCGICNFIESDDMYHKDGYITDNIDDFAYSWLVGSTRDECTLPRVVVPTPEPEICNFTSSPCEMLLDSTMYSKSCLNDVTYSTNARASMCRSKVQYAQQCCERGVSLSHWLLESGCSFSCEEDMVLECTSSCQRTCENYKNYDPYDCTLSPLLTCNCPPDKVFKFGKCVEPKLCEICDDQGHVIGDEWTTGPCETCSCLENRVVHCTTRECSQPPICTTDEELQALPQHKDACCQIYRCIQVAKELCSVPSIPDCEPGQVAKSSIKNDSCLVYECQCDEKLCPPLVRPTSLEEGEEYVLVKKGCCSQYESQCIPDKCRGPIECGPGFKLSTFDGKCCTQRTCVPKKNVCVYQHQFEVVNGTEFRFSPEQYYDKEYESSSSWKDGLCRQCSCIESDGQLSYKCTIEICPDPSQFPDADSYVREAEHIPGMCCPKYRRVQCVHDGVMYSVGDEWPSPDGDKCKSYRCIVSVHGDVTRLERTMICDVKCPKYAVYVEPEPELPDCCGHCKLVGCEENGTIYQDGATWQSETKPCFNAECIVTGNLSRIMYRSESCPAIPSNCPPEDIILDSKGCCRQCTMKRAGELCSPSKIPEHETSQYFVIHDRVRGICTNNEVIKNLSRCSGKCESGLMYKAGTNYFESTCKCCVPSSDEMLEIVLDCSDGSQLKKTYRQPSACHCSSCSGNELYGFEVPPA